MATPTTLKIEARIHARLLRAKKITSLSKADLLRLCLDVGLPRIEAKFVELRGGGGKAGGDDGMHGLALAMEPAQLAEMRELYKSAVTDLIPDINGLEGDKFVAAAETAMGRLQLTSEEEGRVLRFLAVYRQLF